MNPQFNSFAQQPQVASGSSPVVGIAVGGLVLVGLAAGGYVLYNNMKTNEVTPSTQSTQKKAAQSAQTTQSTQKKAAQTTQTAQSTQKAAQSTQKKAGQSAQTPATPPPTVPTVSITSSSMIPLTVPPGTPDPVAPPPMPNVDLAPGNYFIQLHKDPNMVIDIAGANKANGAKAIIYTKNGGANQKFAFIGKTIKAAHSGLVLDADGGLISGTDIQQWQANGLGSDNQRWIPYTDGTIRADANPKMCLDVKGGGGEGTGLIAFECHGGDNQTWDVVHEK